MGTVLGFRPRIEQFAISLSRALAKHSSDPLTGPFEVTSVTRRSSVPDSYDWTTCTVFYTIESSRAEKDTRRKDLLVQSQREYASRCIELQVAIENVVERSILGLCLG